MLCSLQEAGGAKATHESASASLNEEAKLIGDHLFSPCGHTRCPTARCGGLPNHNLQSQETSPGPGRSRFSASAGDAEGWVLQRVRALTSSPLTQPHTDTSLIFSASNPPQIFNPAPHCFCDISLTKMALPADVDFSFSATVFLSTSKAAGIKLALFSIIQHQRHLTDAEEQRFRLNVGRKLSNVSSAEMGKEASGERLDSPSLGRCMAAAGLSTPSVPCLCWQFPVGDSPTLLEKQMGISCGVRSCKLWLVPTELHQHLLPHPLLHHLAAQSISISIQMPKHIPSPLTPLGY